MSYISSNANRFYTALETAYGTAASVTASNRIPAVKLAIKQQREITDRKDKTGSRTFVGLPSGGRRLTAFELQTYMTSWETGTANPAYGPLFQAGMGGTPVTSTANTIATTTSGGQVGFASPHGLSVGQAVATGMEVRFVTAVIDANNVQLNAPFTTAAAASTTNAALTYTLSTELPSATVYDYWSPTTATQRFLTGAAVDEVGIEINGDYHEFYFKGLAQDVQDSTSFTSTTILESYPVEPEIESFDYSIVPGNIGQAWLGTSPNQFFTVTSASVVLKNNLDARMVEFGSSLPQAIAPGRRTVSAALQLFSLDDSATSALYQAARQETPMTVMFQLGDAAGQIMGVYLASVMAEVPEFNDAKNRLQWKFRPSRAQGVVDNEIAIAFA